MSSVGPSILSIRTLARSIVPPNCDSVNTKPPTLINLDSSILISDSKKMEFRAKLVFDLSNLRCSENYNETEFLKRFFVVEKIKELKRLYYRTAHFISDHGMGDNLN